MWRSLVARVVRDDEVAGSNPVTPTTVKPLLREGGLRRLRGQVGGVAARAVGMTHDIPEHVHDGALAAPRALDRRRARRAHATSRGSARARRSVAFSTASLTVHARASVRRRTRRAGVDANARSSPGTCGARATWRPNASNGSSSTSTPTRAPRRRPRTSRVASPCGDAPRRFRPREGPACGAERRCESQPSRRLAARPRVPAPSAGRPGGGDGARRRAPRGAAGGTRWRGRIIRHASPRAPRARRTSVTPSTETGRRQGCRASTRLTPPPRAGRRCRARAT